MKVILVNGSPREKGCTYTALCEVAGALEKNGIETEIFQVGAKPIAGCIGCNVCLKNGRCFVDDPVNEFVEKAKTADGFVFGSPVHYAAASGIASDYILWSVTSVAVEELMKRGKTPGILKSANFPGGNDYNKTVIEPHYDEFGW